MWRQRTTAGTIWLLLLLCSGVVAGDALLLCRSFCVHYIRQRNCDELVDPKYQSPARTTAETAVRGAGAGKRLREQARAYCCPLDWLRIALLLRTTAEEYSSFSSGAVVGRCGRCRLESVGH